MDPDYYYLWLHDQYEKKAWGTAAKRLVELLKKQREIENASGPPLPLPLPLLVVAVARMKTQGPYCGQPAEELHYCLSPARLGWAHLSEPMQTATLLQAHLEGPDR